MNILWITNIPSPYRMDFFNELGKHYCLTVVFEREGSKERDSSWSRYEFINFKGVILNGKKFGSDKAISFGVINSIKSKIFDHIFVSNPFTPTGIIAIAYLRFKRKSYSIIGDGGLSKRGNFIKNKIKETILKGADIYYSTGNTHNEYYLKYNIDRSKIVNYPFSSIRDIEILDRPLDNYEKKHIRKELGIIEDNVILAVGQFIHRKGFDVLIEAASNFDNNIGVYFVGGTPSQEYLSLIQSQNKSNIHFIGFKEKESLKKYFKASDVFVLPTREDIWGLVINEAMACGLPVITTDKCVAGLELIKNGINGYIVKVEDTIGLEKKIQLLLNNPEQIKVIGENNIKLIKNYTIEKMVEAHRVVIDKSTE